MDEPVNDWDQLFASRGGFDSVYKKLDIYAKSLAARYSSDSGGGLAVRQLDSEEIVDGAFERLLSEESLPDEDLYLLLRRHIHNRVRSLAKSAGEGRMVRISGKPEAETAYQETEDIFTESPSDHALVMDDAGHCRKVLMRLLSEEEKDQTVRELAEAMIEGIWDKEELCELLEISSGQYENAFSRLKRRFRNIVIRNRLDERS